MIPFPPQLDGATVLGFARAMPGRIGQDYATGEPVAVAFYAVAQYEGDAPRAYLFAVSSEHTVIGDSLWDSPEEAKQVAESSGHVQPGNWQRPNIKISTTST
jgi:hypothetical protein